MSSVSFGTQDQDFKSQRNFVLNMTCRFCWQLPEADYECSASTSCVTVSCPRQRHAANCTVRDHVHCLGESQREDSRELTSFLPACSWSFHQKVELNDSPEAFISTFQLCQASLKTQNEKPRKFAMLF